MGDRSQWGGSGIEREPAASGARIERDAGVGSDGRVCPINIFIEEAFMKDRHGRSALWSAVMGCVGAVMLSGTAHALPTTDSFVLGGNLNNAGSVHGLVSLQSFPSVTQDVQYLSSGVPTEKTFTGVPLYNFLTSPTGGGGINSVSGPPGTSTSNLHLRDFVVVTGSDSYRAVISAGEINPNFGNKQSLIAYQEGTPPGSLGDDGFARVTVPGDIRGGRYVSNIFRVDVFSASTQSRINAIDQSGLSNVFALDGQVNTPRLFNLEALQALPSVTITTPNDRTFTGVPLWDLLHHELGGGGIIENPEVRNDILGKYVVATGTDGYKAVVALGEFHPGFGANDILVAFDEIEGNDPGLGTAGFARLVVPGDERNGRWVSNLIGLEVFDAPPTVVPIPGAAILFATGLGGLLWRIGSRQKTMTTTV
ncbi:MAG: hypothetical protein KF693_18875 [Nitrospira sp.]|nr:hypothetical protein [Nitrospira sp.]